MSAYTWTRPAPRDTPDEAQPGWVQKVKPSARCHACRSLVVVATCSHCARLLCRVHDFAAGPVGPRAVLQLFQAEPDDDSVNPTPKDAATKGHTADRRRPRSGSEANGTATAGADTRMPGEKADVAAGGKTTGGDGTEPVERTQPKRAPDDDAGRSGQNNADAETSSAAKRAQAERKRRERPRGLARRHYCTDCVPRARPYDAEILAAATTGSLGVVLFPVQKVVGCLLIAAAVVRCAVRVAVDLRRRSRLSARRSADLVLNPNLRRVRTRETIRATARLDNDGHYETTVKKPVRGSVQIEGNWSRAHRAEVVRHRRRTGTGPTTVAAGHLVLHGRARVDFRPTPDATVNGGPALVLKPRVADQEVLHSRDGRGDTRWRPEFHYEIASPENGWTSPVWLTPNIAADLERHVLELHVQWSTRKPDLRTAGQPLRMIEALELDVPAHWGTIEHMTGLGDDRLIGQPYLDEADGVARRRLTWRKIRRPEGKDRDAVRLVVRFSDDIDTDHHLRGRLEARFGGAVSGLTRVGLYRTDGGPVKKLDGTASPQTTIEVDFDLSLQGLRYQQQRVVPDRTRAEDGDRKETHQFPGVAPDHRTVALLTNNLADEGYYVIRVLENPAQPGRRAGSVNRLWDLLGRFYEGVYPIEFHLVLSGEEIHKGQEVTGETSVMLIVSGSYANEVMEQRVIEEWERLWRRIRLSLRAACGERLTTEPLDTPRSELARLRNVMVTETARLSAAADAGRMDAELSTEMVARLTREFGLEER